MRSVCVLFGFFLLFACSRTEQAVCKKDVDCKGDRICDMGTCIEPRMRPVVTKDDDEDPDVDPTPDPPALPNLPHIGQLPTLPNLSIPGFSISGSGFNLKFAVQVGKEEHTIELLPGTSQPMVRWCVDKKCEDVNISSPDDIQKLLDRLLSTASAHDPQLRDTLRMLKDLSVLFNPSGGLSGLPGGPPSSTGSPPFVNTPTGPHHAGVFRTCEEILSAGTQAEGAQADIEELVPTIVSSDQVTFKAPGGILVELQVPTKLQHVTPSLAKTQHAVAVRFRILRATGKYIKGELQQIQVQ